MTALAVLALVAISVVALIAWTLVVRWKRSQAGRGKS